MVLLARTTPLDEVDKSKPTGGLSLFYCDFARGKREGSVVVQPIHKMGGRSVDANQVCAALYKPDERSSVLSKVFFDNFEVDGNDLGKL